MLSKKMTVSLMSLITIFALTFGVLLETQAKDHTFETGIKRGDGVAQTGQPLNIDIVFGAEVSLAEVQKATFTVTIVDADFVTRTAAVTAASAVNFAPTPGAAGPVTQKDIDKTTPGNQYDGKTFTLPINAAALPEQNPTGDDRLKYPKKVHVSLAEGTATSPIQSLDPADAHFNAAGTLTVQIRNTREEADTGTVVPKIVSIQRLRPGSQTVVAAFQDERIPHESFEVRIVATERAHANGLTIGHIDVQNGTAHNFRVGTPFPVRVPSGDGVYPTDGTVPTLQQRGNILRPHPIEGLYQYFAERAPSLDLDGLPPYGIADGTNIKDPVPPPSGPDNMYHEYRVTILPHEKSENFDIKVKVKDFHDGANPRNTYVSPGWDDTAFIPNGRDILTVPVTGAARDKKAGYRVILPKDIVIPAGGYLVIAKNESGSEVVVPPSNKKSPKRTERTPAQMKYNVHVADTLPNLATQFVNGVVVDVESFDRELLITEVMWGEDTSLTPSSYSQYIELYNPGAEYKTIDDKDDTWWVNEAVTLVFYAPNEFDDIPIGEEFREGFLVDESGAVLPSPPWWADGVFVERPDELPWFVSDRIGTLEAEKGGYWSPLGKGQSGRSGKTTGELTTGRGPFEPSVKIVSMYRVMDDDGAIQDGQKKTSWESSEGPKSANFNPQAIGIRHGTPGASTDSTVTPADTEADAKAKADAAAAAAKAAADAIANTGTYPKQGQGRVYISEIMFDGGGTLPQWIEIANGDRSEMFNLSGWTLTVVNAAGDTDVDVGATATFTIPNGTTIDASAQHDTPSTILVVTEKGRTNIDAGPGNMGADQIINLAVDNEVELITAGVLKGKYTLLSDMAFQITLAPPVPKATKAPAGETAAAKATRLANEKKERALRTAATDMVGNLGKDGAATWALPMIEDGRSSIIRRHVQVVRGPAAPEDGMMEENWVLASETSFAQITHIRAESYYGAANDVGTPGFRAGGALPVELSHFRPTRDKATGQVVITWSTQSELNNAGFFIKRSQQRTGEFKVINATMVAGAGTTSEKQFYTYTDTTAQPNVVYYYQIEDVSLDGNRQTLTRGIRLKGHVGAAGKATTLWGELKTSHE